MIDVYFDNIESVVTNNLLLATKSVKICVAWINFDTYGDLFKNLLKNGINVEIIINNDFINNRYAEIINSLKAHGAKIHMVSMPTKRNYMHHKFCIVDERFIMSGSFNWTTNANQNNFENLFKTDDMGVILKFKNEFNSILALSANDIRMLQQFNKCHSCKNRTITICVLSQHGYYDTKVEIYELYSGYGIRHIENKDNYFDISLYNNLISINEKYNDIIEYNYNYGYHDENEIIMNTINCEVYSYLSEIRNNRMGYPIIHAVGIYGCDYNGDKIIKILWKEKFIAQYIENWYYLS